MKRIIYILCIILGMLIFVFVPFPASDLHVKLIFEDTQIQDGVLYFETDVEPGFSQDKYIIIPNENGAVDFLLDSSLADHITGLRIDMPNIDQIICVKNISIHSGGVIKKEYNPCDFFAEENISYTNHISDISLVTSRNRVYMKSSNDDPYLVLSNEFVRDINKYFSHYRLTRFFVFVFVLGSFLSWEKGSFSTNKDYLKKEEGDDDQSKC